MRVILTKTKDGFGQTIWVVELPTGKKRIYYTAARAKNAQQQYNRAIVESEVA